MSVSSITGITLEGQPQELASFLRLGVMYVVWHSPNSLSQKKLRWKPHTGADFTEVLGDLSSDFKNISSLYHPASDSVVVSWDDGLGQPGVSNATIYIARFNVTSGALLFGPVAVGPGTRPQMMYKNNSPGDVFYMFSFMSKTDDVTIRTSQNGGQSWGEAAPVLTNKTSKTRFVEAVAYDDSHVSIAQLGQDSRTLSEFGVFKRTRPLVSILKHPSVAGQFFVGEPSRITSVAQSDNLRGPMTYAVGGGSILKIDGDAQGVSDAVGGIALLTVSGTTLAVTSSAGPTPGTNRNKIVQYSLTPTLSSSADLDASLPVVSMDVSSGFAYLAQSVDANPTGGQLKVVQLSSLSTQSAFLTGVSGRAVAVARFLAPNLIFAATTESSVERLRVYQENGTTPTSVANFKLPFRANSILLSTHPGNPAWAFVYVSASNRLAVFEFRGTSLPLRLVNTIPLVGGGQFFGLAVAGNGNIVAAAGNAGVLVLNPKGRALAQTQVSGQVVNEWTPTTVFALNALVKPRAQHPFSTVRGYFRCSTGGTSGAMEPSWASSGTIVDSSAQWQYVGSMDGVATGVAVDDTLKRIYAVGLAGGNTGTDGRVWVLDARGLL